MSAVNLNCGVHGPLFQQYIRNENSQDVTFDEMDRLEMFMGNLEEVLDYAGGIPVLSSATGTFRAAYGLTQLVTAIVSRLFGMIGSTFAENKNDVESWEKFKNRANMHIFEGCKNIGRGLSEAIPIVNLLWWMTILDRELVAVINTFQTHSVVIDGTRYNSMRNFYDGELKKMILLKNQI